MLRPKLNALDFGTQVPHFTHFTSGTAPESSFFRTGFSWGIFAARIFLNI
jgi:hypothetical protein